MFAGGAVLHGVAVAVARPFEGGAVTIHGHIEVGRHEASHQSGPGNGIGPFALAVFITAVALHPEVVGGFGRKALHLERTDIAVFIYRAVGINTSGHVGVVRIEVLDGGVGNRPGGLPFGASLPVQGDADGRGIAGSQASRYRAGPGKVELCSPP